MYVFKVKGMTCPSCARVMKLELAKMDSEADVEVNLPSQTVKVTSTVSESRIASIIEATGFSVIESKKILPMEEV